MRIIGEMAKILAFLVWFFHVFFPGCPLHFAWHFHPGGTAFCATRGETKKRRTSSLPNTARQLAPVPNFALRDEAKRARTCRRRAHCTTKRWEDSPTTRSRRAEKSPMERANDTMRSRKHRKRRKMDKKNGNEPSHDETFPHRTYIEMKKLSRNLVVNVTTSTTMVGAVSLTPRKYGQKSNRPNIYPIFFIQIVNDFATF